MWVDERLCADKPCFTELGFASSCGHFDGVYGCNIWDSLSGAHGDISLLGCHFLLSAFLRNIMPSSSSGSGSVCNIPEGFYLHVFVCFQEGFLPKAIWIFLSSPS